MLNSFCVDCSGKNKANKSLKKTININLKTTLKLVVVVYKCLYGLAPWIIIPCWRTSSSIIVGVSRVSAFRFVSWTVCSPYPTLSLWRPSFSSRICNSLLQRITSAPSLPVFCCRLKTYFLNFVTRNYCCYASKVTLSFMDMLIAFAYLLT